jgi:23S rRNA-/tRNA-specific pseudouridylate synthase
MEILFEDYYLLVINKAAGLPVQSDNYESVESLVEKHFETKHSKKQFFGFPHQLDRAVSGILILAKTPQALKHLNQQFETRKLKKIYLAECEIRSELPLKLNQKLAFSEYISRTNDNKKALISLPTKKQIANALLNVKAVEITENKVLFEVELLSGKYHQIRAQLAFHGFPILFDTLYNGNEIAPEKIHLHCQKMVFSHPKTDDKIEMKCSSAF